MTYGHKGYGRSKKQLEARHDEILKLYGSGFSESEISKALGYKSCSTVYGVVKNFASTELKEQHLKSVCPVCGKEFVKNRNDRKYCSDECANSSRVVSTVRKRSLSNIQIIDRNITLQEVYRKNNGICYLCGEKCDVEDFQIKNGKKICGRNYPSIDHVIPLGAGGAHSWENVRLAHIRCNSIKSTLERADRRKRNDGRQMERTNKTVMS